MAADLSALADAWDAPDAWEGMTQAGGQELPGAMAGRIALDELVVHGWDIAQATGQRFDCEAVTLGEVEATVQQVRGGNDGDIPGLFGPVVAVADDADALERVLSLTGRDPVGHRPEAARLHIRTNSTTITMPMLLRIVIDTVTSGSAPKGKIIIRSIGAMLRTAVVTSVACLIPTSLTRRLETRR